MLVVQTNLACIKWAIQWQLKGRTLSTRDPDLKVKIGRLNSAHACFPGNWHVHS